MGKRLLFCAPQGFNPGNRSPRATSPEGAAELPPHRVSRFSAAPSGRDPIKNLTQAKAWAMLSWPFRPTEKRQSGTHCVQETEDENDDEGRFGAGGR
jgi:hypothetical protein